MDQVVGGLSEALDPAFVRHEAAVEALLSKQAELSAKLDELAQRACPCLRRAVCFATMSMTECALPH